MRLVNLDRYLKEMGDSLPEELKSAYGEWVYKKFGVSAIPTDYLRGCAFAYETKKQFEYQRELESIIDQWEETH